MGADFMSVSCIPFLDIFAFGFVPNAALPLRRVLAAALLDVFTDVRIPARVRAETSFASAYGGGRFVEDRRALLAYTTDHSLRVKPQ
jgi:hypothetical protein